MAKAPYIPLYVRDILCSRRCSAMTGDEFKAYIYLLCEAWLQDDRATLPNQESELMEMARVTFEQWITIRDKVLRMFELNDSDRLYNDRLFEEHLKSIAKKRPNNKNANGTQNERKNSQIERKVNATTDIDTDNAIDTEIKEPLTKEVQYIPAQQNLSASEVMQPLTEPLEALYRLWKSHLMEKQAPLTQSACTMLRKRFRAWGEEKTKRLVETAISKNWKSIVEDERQYNNSYKEDEQRKFNRPEPKKVSEVLPISSEPLASAEDAQKVVNDLKAKMGWN